jgi:hypothetical protein
MRKNGGREGSSKNPSRDVYRPANPAKLVCSTKEARNVLINVILAGKIKIKNYFFTEIGLRCALRTIYGVKKVLVPSKCPIV